MNLEVSSRILMGIAQIGRPGMCDHTQPHEGHDHHSNQKRCKAHVATPGRRPANLTKMREYGTAANTETPPPEWCIGTNALVAMKGC